MKAIRSVSVLFIVSILFISSSFAQTDPGTFSGKRLKRIVVRNAMVVDGSGKPAGGAV